MWLSWLGNSSAQHYMELFSFPFSSFFPRFLFSFSFLYSMFFLVLFLLCVLPRQTNGVNGEKKLYTGMWDCMKQILKREVCLACGVLRRLG